MINYQKWSEHASPICIDVNITVLEIVPNAHLWPNPARTPPPLELANELMRPLVEAKDISIDVNTRTICPTIWVIVDSGFLEQCLDVAFGNFL